MFGKTTGGKSDSLACTDCPAGYYNILSAKETCIACTSSYPYTNPQRAYCVNSCPKGSFIGETNNVCFYCPIGKFQTAAHKGSCDTPNGCYVDKAVGQDSCTACAAGKYYNAEDFSCFLCMNARRRRLYGYQFNPAITNQFFNHNLLASRCECGTSCKDCPVGTFASGTGNPACTVWSTCDD